MQKKPGGDQRIDYFKEFKRGCTIGYNLFYLNFIKGNWY
jgi:hypothetical protein